MADKIQAACRSCSRGYEFDPAHVKKTCMFCGGEIDFPDGEPEPLPVATGINLRYDCPICGRSKELDTMHAGQEIQCWFCSSSLIAPLESGQATLDIAPEEPADTDLPAIEGRDPHGLSSLIRDVLRTALRAGQLGKDTATWIPTFINDLTRWEQSDNTTDTPFDPYLTSEILRTVMFQTESATDKSLDGERRRVRIRIDSHKEGIGEVASTAISTAIGLTVLAATGSGWVGGGVDDEVEIVMFLEIDLIPEGTGTSLIYRVVDNWEQDYSVEAVLPPDYAVTFPQRFALSARALLAFKAIYGLGAPGKLLPYVNEDGLTAQLVKLGGSTSWASTQAQAFLQVIHTNS